MVPASFTVLIFDIFYKSSYNAISFKVINYLGDVLYFSNSSLSAWRKFGRTKNKISWWKFLKVWNKKMNFEAVDKKLNIDFIIP